MTQETIKEVLENNREKSEIVEALKKVDEKVALVESEGSFFIEVESKEEINESLQFLKG